MLSVHSFAAAMSMLSQSVTDWQSLHSHNIQWYCHVFISVIQKYSEQAIKSGSKTTLHRTTECCQTIVHFILKPHKAAWPDGIPTQLLKRTAEEIAPALTLLFQAARWQGKVLSMWKKAFVVPLFKKGNRALAFNYRWPPSCATYVSISYIVLK